MKNETSEKNVWKQLFNEHWTDAIADDDVDIDMDLIAAYAEGRLTPTQILKAQELLAASPIALECYTAMREEVLAEQAATAPIAAAGQSRAPESLPAKSTQRTSASWTAPVMAASLLIACLSAGWALKERSGRESLQSEVAALSNSLTHEENLRQTRSLLAPKEQAITLAAQRNRLYLAGEISSGMIRTAALRFPAAKSTDPPVRVEPKLAESLSDRWHEALDELPDRAPEDVSVGIEEAFRLLSQAVLENVDSESEADVEYRFSAAVEAFDKLKASYPEAPEVANLEAVILLTRAPYLTKTNSDAATTRARTILNDLTESHPDFAAAWLNLALLTLSEDGLDASRTYWQKYASLTDDEDQKRAVRELLN